MSKEFKRQDISRFLKIGKSRRHQKWRRPKGRHSKMRKKRKSYPASPSVGYKSSRKESGKIENLIPVLVYNIQDLQKLQKSNSAIIASRVGAKKKIDLIKKASEMKIKILNLGEQK